MTDEEHTWLRRRLVVAGLALLALAAAVGLTACYEQVSFCGGVYVIERPAVPG